MNVQMLFNTRTFKHLNIQTKNMKYFIPLFCCFAFNLFGQDTTQLTNTFEFNNGVYLTINDLHANQPNYTWADVQASAHMNREKNVIRIEYLQMKDSTKVNILDNDIWGICVNGVPYIRIVDSMRQQTLFVGLRTRGKLCYFQYDSYKMKEVPMTVYDPNTGEPVFTKNVENKAPVKVHQMLNFKTGEVENLELNMFKSWIKDDSQLTNTINGMTIREANKKLYKMLLIYNDRNPYFLIRN